VESRLNADRVVAKKRVVSGDVAEGAKRLRARSPVGAVGERRRRFRVVKKVAAF
jgi:hypothetical protein